MFLPKRPAKRTRQKSRTTETVGALLPNLPQPTIFALQGGYWAASLVAHVFVKLKKLSKQPHTFAKF